MNSNNYCVIMAGGVGSRFWPVSRIDKPKQFLDMLNTGKTFIQSTFERFVKFIPLENFLVITNSMHKQLVLEQLPALNENQVLCEPLGRNTAVCIAYASFRLKAMNPGATMIVTPADHLIQNEADFADVLTEAADFASGKDVLVTIGLKPTRPDTGYGYIQVEKPFTEAGMNKVKTFTEKPDRQLAEAFLNSGDFFWNSGIFVWTVDAIMKSLKEFLPDTWHMFDSIHEFYNTPREQEHINIIYPECRSISIDYGIMEVAGNVHVRCADFGWSDIGTWRSLYQFMPKDEHGNTGGQNIFPFETKDCLVKIPKNKIAVIEGLDDFIVVDTEDALVICPKSNEQNIKKYIDTVKYTFKEDKYI